MSRTLTLPTDEKFYDRKGVVEVAHELGLTHVTEGTVVRAAYYGNKPLQRTKIGNRVYFARTDIENWIAGSKL